MPDRRKMPKTFRFFWLLPFCLVAWLARAEETGARQDQSYEGFAKRTDSRYRAFEERVTQDFEFFQTENGEAYETRIKEANLKWDSTFAPEAKRQVLFSKDGNRRLSVDYEKGEMVYEELLPEEPFDAEKVLGSEATAFRELARETNRRYGEEKNFFLRSFDATQTPEREIEPPVEFRDGKGVPRKKTRVRRKMLSEHLNRRERLVYPTVAKYSDLYGVERALVMAVIKAESSFNPASQTYVEHRDTFAVGLMQIVPELGGREAHAKVFGKPAVLETERLKDVDLNVRLGTAYLSLLQSDYFSWIRDEETRRYLAIAAYNTGPSNVSKAFFDAAGHSGSHRLANLHAKINPLSGKEVLARLRRNLPYRETRNYLPRVVGFLEDYRQRGLNEN